MKELKISGFKIIEFITTRKFRAQCLRCDSRYWFSIRGKHECKKCKRDTEVRRILKEAQCDLLLVSGEHYTFGCRACHTETTKTYKSLMRYFKYHETMYACPSCADRRRSIEAFKELKKKVYKQGGKLLSGPFDDIVHIQCIRCGAKKKTSNFNIVCNTCDKKSKKRLTYDDMELKLSLLGWTVLFTKEEFDVHKNIAIHKFRLMCGVCGSQVKTSITRIIYRKVNQCRSCSHMLMGIKISKPYLDIKKAIDKKGYELLTKPSEYNNSKQRLKIKCPEGHKFDYLFQAFGNVEIPCRKCNYKAKRFSSKKEKAVASYVKTLSVDVEESNRSILPGNYELDIYIPKHKFAIEFNGIIWHSEKFKKKTAATCHLQKTKWCADKNIRLLHIFEDEWEQKQEIVKSMISARLGKSERIFARKTSLEEVGSVRDFMNENHIQGNAPSSVKICLVYDGIIVSSVTFGKPRFNSSYEWEIIRYCNLVGTTVVGGFSKMLKRFITEYKPSNMITYADLRFGTGDVYEKNGFKFIRDNKPTYYYVAGKERHNRMKYQKHKLPKILSKFDPALSESENMRNNGFYRIYDCGNRVFEWKKNKGD